MKHYTSIEQSKKLLELGLDSESADLYYSRYGIELSSNKVVDKKVLVGSLEVNTKRLSEEDIPCWSVGALMELMPKIRTNYGIMRPKSVKEEGSRFKYRFYYEAKYYTDLKETVIDACYEMIVWLLENDYIKK